MNNTADAALIHTSICAAGVTNRPDRRAKSDILPAIPSTQSVCGMEIIMRKSVRTAATITAAALLSLGNMESQKAVAVAPIVEHTGTGRLQELRKVQTPIHGTILYMDAQKMEQLRELRSVHEKEYRIVLKQQKQEQQRRQRMEQLQKVCGTSVSTEDRRILERIVEAEAGNQDIAGRCLVANVILNRVSSKSFPSTIREVVFAPRQFSPVSDGRYYSVTVSDKTREAVSQALQGIDRSQGALYFMDRRYSDPSNVSWFDRCLTRLFYHQGHDFYK